MFTTEDASRRSDSMLLSLLGTRVAAWANNTNFNQCWRVEHVDKEDETYRIQNVQSGTYLALIDGVSAVNNALQVEWSH